MASPPLVSKLDFQYRNGGLHFPQLGLWMDPHHPVRTGEWVVVSHAHSDHTARHSAVILTEPTRRLMRSRISGTRAERVLGFNECLHQSDLESSKAQTPFRLSLHPAGHVLGSAMARLEVDGDSLLYTGDFKLREGRSSERCEPVHARTLVMETTYGRPRYIFPPTEEVLASVLQCRNHPGAGGLLSGQGTRDPSLPSQSQPTHPTARQLSQTDRNLCRPRIPVPPLDVAES